MGRLYLIRHGEVEWNARNSYIGATDLPLNSTGMDQARQLAEYLLGRDVAAIYSSDLSRARQTAETIGERLGIPVTLCPEFRELNYGEWEGVPETEVAERYPEIHPRWYEDSLGVRIPGGETLAELRDRVLPAFHRIAERHREDNAVIVAHKSTNRLILASLMGMDLNRCRQIGQGNACLNTIHIRTDGTLSVENINERCHLLGESGK